MAALGSQEVRGVGDPRLFEGRKDLVVEDQQRLFAVVVDGQFRRMTDRADLFDGCFVLEDRFLKKQHIGCGGFMP